MGRIKKICGVILVLYCIGRVWWSDFSLKEFTSRFTTSISLQRDNAEDFTNFLIRLEDRMQKRRKMVADYCKTHKINNSLYLKEFGSDRRHFQVFRKSKVIYCFVPKVASKQWTETLSVLKKEDEQMNRVANTTGMIKNNLNFFSEQDAWKMLKRYFTFMFVRDPLERILSAYKDKLLKDNKYYRNAIGRKIIAKFRPNATRQALKTGSVVTFPEFTDFLLQTKDSDVHWKSFTNLCYPCAVNYDFIGHYEDLAEEAPYLVKKVGIYRRVSFPTVHASNTTAELSYYYSQIPNTKILQLAKMYENDFKMFNFTFPGKLAKLFDSENSKT